ncbi:MAG: chemotaxis protein CheW [Vicinamibacterales bacterium]
MPVAALVLLAGDRRCAIPLTSVLEVARPLPLVQVDRQSPPVLGLARFRGRPVPVVDLAAVLGVAASPARRFVSLRVGDRAVALAVGDVDGVEWFEPESFSALPALVVSSSPGPVAALAERDHELLLVLDGGRLLQHGEEPAA